MRKKYSFSWVLALASWGLGAAAQPEAPPAANDSLNARLQSLVNVSGGLMSEEVGRRAEATSYDVRARRADIEVAAAGLNQAYAAYFPRITLAASYTRLSPISLPSFGNIVIAQNAQPGQKLGPNANLTAYPFTFPVFLDQYVLQANATVPLSDYILRLSQSYAAASHSERGASLNERAARLKAASDAKTAYYTWVRARLQQVIAEQALVQAKAHLTDAQHTFQAGTSSKADVLSVEAQVASNELLVARAKDLVDVLEDQVRTVMHESDMRSYAIGEDVRVDLPPLSGTENMASLYSEAISRRLEIRALDETVYSLREQSKAAQASYYPRLDALGNVTYANPNQRYVPAVPDFKLTWSAGVQLSWSPNDIGVAAPSVKTFDARASQTEAQKASLQDSLRMEVMQANQALRDAEAAVRTSVQGLASAEESYRVRRELFRIGRATSVELSDAETELTRTRFDAINARIDLRIARIKLLHALGRDAPQMAGP